MGEALERIEIFGWGVVETHANAEGRAERALCQLGYEPLVVRYTKLLRGVRIALDGRRIRSRKDELVPRPFIPGYLFLPIPDGDDATLVDRADGVRRLFRHRDSEGYLAKPKIIRGRIIEQIKQAALDMDETPKPIRSDLRELLDKGETPRIRIPGGIEALLIGLDEKGRAEYLAYLMGGQVRGTTSDASAIELVEA